MSPNRLARLHHCILRGTLAASFLLVLATAAFAQEPPAALADPVSAASSSVPRTDNATRIEIDQKAGVIRFVIRGEERAVLDDAGLHVNGDFEFTGQTEDIGEWSNREAANAP